ncbi:MAG: hypothetical protein KAW12_20930 [Candidatus Aminicenantes bacterium]|nr:hypothetical protein [Candidatus Aminicenantes bacterium]
MLAVEFETHVENGVINIPEKYREMIDGDLRIIILKQEKQVSAPGDKKKQNIKKLLRRIREKGIFRDIDNPAAWQRTIRDEWA